MSAVDGAVDPIALERDHSPRYRGARAPRALVRFDEDARRGALLRSVEHHRLVPCGDRHDRATVGEDSVSVSDVRVLAIECEHLLSELGTDAVADAGVLIDPDLHDLPPGSGHVFSSERTDLLAKANPHDSQVATRSDVQERAATRGDVADERARLGLRT
jgi:hypothetical protein